MAAALTVTRYVSLPDGKISGGSDRTICIELEEFVNEVAKRFFASKQEAPMIIHSSMSKLQHAIIKEIRDKLDREEGTNPALVIYRGLSQSDQNIWITKVALAYCNQILKESTSASTDTCDTVALEEVDFEF